MHTFAIESSIYGGRLRRALDESCTVLRFEPVLAGARHAASARRRLTVAAT
jgi:hypothetical protein